MKKYLEIAKAYMKAQLIWRSDTLVDVILAVAKILFAWILWSILFEGKEQIAGLGFQAMISYYIISSYLFQMEKSAEISQQMTGMLRNGTFSKYMVIPVQTQGYFVAMEVGKLAFFFRHWLFSNGSVVLFVPDFHCTCRQLEDIAVRNDHGCFRSAVYGFAQLFPWDFNFKI